MSTITSIPHSPAAHAKTATIPLEERGVIRDASWYLYDRLSDAIGERSLFRLAYDGRDIEIMARGRSTKTSRNFSVYSSMNSTSSLKSTAAGWVRRHGSDPSSAEASRRIFVFTSTRRNCKSAKQPSPATPTTSPTIPIRISPSRSISRRQRSTVRESTPPFGSPRSGGSRASRSPSNSSAPTAGTLRRSRASSCMSRPRKSRGGSSPRIPATGESGESGFRSGYTPS